MGGSNEDSPDPETQCGGRVKRSFSRIETARVIPGRFCLRGAFRGLYFTSMYFLIKVSTTVEFLLLTWSYFCKNAAPLSVLAKAV